MSEHRVDIVPVILEKHPNADSLSIVRVGEYVCVARTEDWIGKNKAAYVEPDYMVPSDRDEFKFLGASLKEQENNGVKGYRIKAKRLRGVMSMGLLAPCPTGAEIGDNVIDRFGIARYEPPIRCCGTNPGSTPGVDATGAPPGVYYKYDIENGYKYCQQMIDGEEVVVTEKVHGANGRYCFLDGQMNCSSRTEWKKESEGNLWWKALANHPELRTFCEANPGVCVYGEIYGQVQNLKYGLNQVKFVAFDLLRAGRWIPHDEAHELGKDLPWVPVLYRGPYVKETIFALADGDSVVASWRGAKQIREGIVIKPVVERSCHALPRVQIKLVSNEYLERA